MNITITKTENGFEVKLPYALKDSFKKAIPSAKWNPAKKCWEIGPRSGKKAEAWAEQAQSVAQLNDEVAEIEATEQEFQAALHELENIKKRLAQKKEKNKSLDLMLSEINDLKNQIEKAQNELTKEAEEVAEKETAIQNVVANLIDIAETKRAIAQMAQLQGKLTSKNRRLFQELQDVINEARTKMRKAGLGSYGLDDLWRINWNRPDRDKVADCRSIFEIYQIKNNDE